MLHEKEKPRAEILRAVMMYCLAATADEAAEDVADRRR